MMNLFDRLVEVGAEDIDFDLSLAGWTRWSDFFLNPRRLRGSDFLMRWSQGVWSEKRLVQAVKETGRFFALPYGPSGTAPEGDVRAHEQYFERLEKAGLGDRKRPDLLVFRDRDEPAVQGLVQCVGGIEELPFRSEAEPEIRSLLGLAIVAIECENSLWRCRSMPDFGAELKPQARLAGRPGLKKSAVLPTIILKEEDRAPLKRWHRLSGIPIHIWHVFYDMAFGIALDEAEHLISQGLIEPTRQVFQAPGGATTEKIIYKVYYQYGYLLGESEREPDLVADSIMDKNGHILPFVRFEGGRLRMSPESVALLERLATVRGGC